MKGHHLILCFAVVVAWVAGGTASAHPVWEENPCRIRDPHTYGSPTNESPEVWVTGSFVGVQLDDQPGYIGVDGDSGTVSWSAPGGGNQATVSPSRQCVTLRGETLYDSDG